MNSMVTWNLCWSSKYKLYFWGYWKMLEDSWQWWILYVYVHRYLHRSSSHSFFAPTTIDAFYFSSSSSSSLNSFLFPFSLKGEYTLVDWNHVFDSRLEESFGTFNRIRSESAEPWNSTILEGEKVCHQYLDLHRIKRLPILKLRCTFNLG